MNNINGPSTPLARYVQQRYEIFKQNRAQAEDKWKRNRDTINKVFRYGLKEDEGEIWRSRFTYGFARQKAMALFSVVCDTVLTGGEIPFMCKVDEDFAASEPQFSPALRATEELLKRCIEQTKAEREFMRAVMSAAYFGEGWVKCKVAPVSRIRYAEVGAAGVDTSSLPLEQRRWVPVEEEELLPTFEWIPVQNMYWDMEARDYRNCTGIIHETPVTAHELRQCKGLPGFIDSAIEAVIRKADRERSYSADQDEPRLAEIVRRTRTINLREYWGLVPRQRALDFEQALLDPQCQGLAIGGDPDDASDRSGDDVIRLVTIAEGEIVRYLEIGKRDMPFHRILCEEDINSPLGVGVADNAEQVQDAINGAVRLFIDNKVLTANGVIATKTNYLERDFSRVYPGLRLEVSEDCNDARQAVAMIEFPDVGQMVLDLVNLLFQLGEDETMIPKIQQGMASVDGKVTAFEIGKRVEMSQKFMGTVIRNLDEDLIEEVFNWMLRYIQQDPKWQHLAGPFTIQALGFSSFLNRQVKLQRLMQRLQLALQSPQLTALTKMRAVLCEIDKLMDFDPDQFTVSEEELQVQQALQAAAQQQQLAGPGPTAIPAGTPTELPAGSGGPTPAAIETPPAAAAGPGPGDMGVRL